MKTRWSRAGALVAAFFLSAVFSGVAKADAPDPAAAQVQSFYDVLLDSMKHAKDLGLKGRYEKLKPAIEQTFDLQGMTALAVGPSWNTIGAADKQALLAAFERMTIANYAKNFDGFGGEKFIVEPGTTARGTDKVVHSKLVTSDATIPFNYRMRQNGSSWKILDIYLNGYVSQLATQRSEYTATLALSGSNGLVKKLNAMADKIMKGE